MTRKELEEEVLHKRRLPVVIFDSHELDSVLADLKELPKAPESPMGWELLVWLDPVSPLTSGRIRGLVEGPEDFGFAVIADGNLTGKIGVYRKASRPVPRSSYTKHVSFVNAS